MTFVDLGIGHPEDAILPLAALREAAAHRFGKGDPFCLQYGPEQGTESLRCQLAAFLSRHGQTPVQPTDLLITTGASHGLELALQQFTRPGDTIFVEDPTYYFVWRMLADRNLRPVPIRTDDHGLDISDLEERLQTDRPSLLYTVPVFHNPTGTTLPLERRQRLVSLAREHNFLIVADEVYQLLALNRVPECLATFGSQQVLSLGSFSKILGPGVRLGWIQSAPQNLDRLLTNGALLSSGGANPLVAAIVESALELGLQDACLRDLAAVFHGRLQFMNDLLREVLPQPVRFRQPDGGFFFWIELPPELHAARIREEAIGLNIDFRPGPLFSCANNFPNFLRLCCAFYDRDLLRFGCEQLGRLLMRHV